MSISFKQGGEFKTVTDSYYKQNGVWKRITNMYTKQEGTFRNLTTPSVLEPFTINASDFGASLANFSNFGSNIEASGNIVIARNNFSICIIERTGSNSFHYSNLVPPDPFTANGITYTDNDRLGRVCAIRDDVIVSWMRSSTVDTSGARTSVIITFKRQSLGVWNPVSAVQVENVPNPRFIDRLTITDDRIYYGLGSSKLEDLYTIGYNKDTGMMGATSFEENIDLLNIIPDDTSANNYVTFDSVEDGPPFQLSMTYYDVTPDQTLSASRTAVFQELPSSLIEYRIDADREAYDGYVYMCLSEGYIMKGNIFQNDFRLLNLNSLLPSSLDAANIEWGEGVNVYNDLLFIGGNPLSFGPAQENVYVFRVSPTDPYSYSLVEVVTDPAGETGIRFGSSVYYDGRFLYVGAEDRDVGTNTDVGSITIFDKSY